MKARTAVAGRGEKSLISGPGSELRLEREKEKERKKNVKVLEEMRRK